MHSIHVKETKIHARYMQIIISAWMPDSLDLDLMSTQTEHKIGMQAFCNSSTDTAYSMYVWYVIFHKMKL